MVITQTFVDSKLEDQGFDRSSNVMFAYPRNIVRIDDYAFHDIVHLQSIRLDSSTEEIGQNAFENCLELSSIDLSEVERIEPYAFYNCQKLSACNLDNLKGLSCCAFYGSGESSLSIHMSQIEEFSSFDELGSLSGFTFAVLIMDKIQTVPSIQQPDIDWLGPDNLNAKIYVHANIRDEMLADSAWSQIADQIETL